MYQASRDGFGASDFHSKTNGVQGTLTVIKTINSFIFGGYTEADWDGYDYYYKNDPNAFIFSLVNSLYIPVKMKVKPSSYAIYSDISYGPTFGEGHDFYISDQSNTNTDSYSYISSYEMPDFGSSSSFLAGTSYFKTFEIEVYSVFIDRKFFLIYLVNFIFTFNFLKPVGHLHVKMVDLVNRTKVYINANVLTTTLALTACMSLLVLFFLKIPQF